ncbi:uncharacterized protein V6R79_014807 [Siganus canaliculatus]
MEEEKLIVVKEMTRHYQYLRNALDKLENLHHTEENIKHNKETATMGCNSSTCEPVKETVFLSKENEVYRIPAHFYHREEKVIMAFAEQRTTSDDASAKKLVMKTRKLMDGSCCSTKTTERTKNLHGFCRAEDDFRCCQCKKAGDENKKIDGRKLLFYKDD